MAALIRARIPDWAWGESFLADTLVADPWADRDLPSLVAVDEQDEVVGFIGAQVRRMRLDERTLRGVCCSHLVVVADDRARAAGALLLRRMLSGPQDLTWTDSANDTVVSMWRTFGGYLDHTRAYEWMLVLSPLRWAGAMLRAGTRRGGRARELAPVRALPAHAAGSRLVRSAFPDLASEVSGEQTTAAAIVEHLPALTRKLRLRVDYDRAHLDHVLAQVEAVAGRLVCRLVRRRGTPIGWYSYVRQAGGVSRVLHLCALERETDAVFGELVEYARADGSAVVTGRVEPHLQWPLRRRHAVLGFARQPVIHAREPEIRTLLATRSSLLTKLDGEWFVA